MKKVKRVKQIRELVSQKKMLREALEKQRKVSRVISKDSLEGSVANGLLLAGTCCGSRTSNDCKSK